MTRIGITGGIGSGKSVVVKILRLLGVPSFDSDYEAKMLNDTSPVIRERLTAEFGDELYAGGTLNKKLFASIIFGDEDKLKLANSIIHPAVAEHFIKWCKMHESYPLVAIDSAILFDAGFDKYVDKVVTVYSPKDLRIERVMKRDDTERRKVLDRMDKQMSEETKVKMSDFIIYNNEEESLIKQTKDLFYCFSKK